MKNFRAAFKRTFSFKNGDPNKGEGKETEHSSAGSAARNRSFVTVDQSGNSFLSEAGNSSDRYDDYGQPPTPTSPPTSSAASQHHSPPVVSSGMSSLSTNTATTESSNSSHTARTTSENQRVMPKSVTIAVAQHCPPELLREKWSLEDFELKKQMYAGQISLVYHAIDRRSGISVALKLYRRSKLNEMERHQVAREIKLHIELHHDGIITLYSSWKDRNYVYMALEFAPAGDVYSFVRSRGGKLPEDVAVPLIMEPFLSAIKYIHDLGLIHRDIKPENILMTASFQIKIADFGLSIDSKQEIANTRLGTIDYLAPEILDCPVKNHPLDNKDKPSIGYTNKVDCWSIGVLAYEVLTGKPPFEAMNAQETLRLIKTKTVEYPDYLSPGAIDFIHSALDRDPEKRVTVAQLMQHPWIRLYMKRREEVSRRAVNRRGLRRSQTFNSSKEEGTGKEQAKQDAEDRADSPASSADAALAHLTDHGAAGKDPAGRVMLNRSFYIKRSWAPQEM